MKMISLIAICALFLSVNTIAAQISTTTSSEKATYLHSMVTKEHPKFVVTREMIQSSNYSKEANDVFSKHIIDSTKQSLDFIKKTDAIAQDKFLAAIEKSEHGVLQVDMYGEYNIAKAKAKALNSALSRSGLSVLSFGVHDGDYYLQTSFFVGSDSLSEERIANRNFQFLSLIDALEAKNELQKIALDSLLLGFQEELSKLPADEVDFASYLFKLDEVMTKLKESTKLISMTEQSSEKLIKEMEAGDLIAKGHQEKLAQKNRYNDHMRKMCGSLFLTDSFCLETASQYRDFGRNIVKAPTKDVGIAKACQSMTVNACTGNCYVQCVPNDANANVGVQKMCASFSAELCKGTCRPTCHSRL